MRGAQGGAEIGVAGLQGGNGLHVAGRDVVEHDDVCDFRTAARGLFFHRPLDQPQAVLDASARRTETTVR